MDSVTWFVWVGVVLWGVLAGVCLRSIGELRRSPETVNRLLEREGEYLSALLDSTKVSGGVLDRIEGWGEHNIPVVITEFAGTRADVNALRGEVIALRRELAERGNS